MSIESALYTRLKAVSAVTTIVGTGNSARIYPDVAPPSATLSYITYTVVSDSSEQHMTAAAGLASAVIQIDCWAASSVNRGALREAVRGALDGARQQTWGTVQVRSVMREQSRSTWEKPEDGSEVGVFRASMDFRFWYVESVPTF